MKYHIDPIIIDIEASGFGSDSYPIEIGVALPDKQKYCSLIKPADGWTHWDQSAESVHGISLETLHDVGKSPHEVAYQLNKMLEGKTAFSDGWVVDKPWLVTLFEAASREMKFTLSPLEMILSEKQMDNWHETKSIIIEQNHGDRHRASYDAWVIQETFNQTL